MQHRTPSCQLHTSNTGDSSAISLHASDTQYPRTGTLARGTQQEVHATTSRRSGPRRWLRAVRWLIAAGLHPRANTTTLQVAEDLAQRMDYDLGHVLYRIDAMVARTGISKASIKRHVGYLRELGALAWLQHGSRTNWRRACGLPGYAGTATVYAAVIPPAYDHAMGHTVIGSGYDARVVIDRRGQAPTHQSPVDNPPVDNSGSKGLEPPSLTSANQEGKLKVESGFNYTPQAGREPRSHPSSSKNGQRRTATDVLRAMRTVRLVRALVNWTQRVPLRRLEFVLRPLTDRGLDAQQIADELHGMALGWRPAKPAAYIQSCLASETLRQAELAQHEADLAASVKPMDNEAVRDWMSLEKLFALPAAPEPERTDDDRRRARMTGWNQWWTVAADHTADPADAVDLYGTRLVKFAIRKQIDAEEKRSSRA